MHRRTAIRDALAVAVAAVAPTVDKERATRIPDDGVSVVSVQCREEALDGDEGSMGEPTHHRLLLARFVCHTQGASGLAAVEAVDALDEAIGLALDGDPTLGGLALDMQWASIETTITGEQERFNALGVITYEVFSAVDWGNPT